MLCYVAGTGKTATVRALVNKLIDKEKTSVSFFRFKSVLRKVLLAYFSLHTLISIVYKSQS